MQIRGYRHIVRAGTYLQSDRTHFWQVNQVDCERQIGVLTTVDVQYEFIQ